MKERFIICEIVTGSHLYGTNRPQSDLDYTGVFMPGTDDIFSLQRCPTEWTKNEKHSSGERNVAGDIDRKFYSIQRFLQLAGEGQPSQLELLFAPPEAIQQSSPEWDLIKSQASIFLSKKSIAPFVGFALSQAHKATIKGANLNLIRDVLDWGYRTLYERERNVSLAKVASIDGDSLLIRNSDKVIILKIVTNTQGFRTVEIGGRNYDVNLKTKTFLENLKVLEERYGSRAKNAADKTYDYKSLMHAYRMLAEARELLATGKITLPRPPGEILFYKSILALGDPGNQVIDNFDHFGELTARIDELRQQLEPKSALPDEPNWAAINRLCTELLRSYLLESK